MGEQRSGFSTISVGWHFVLYHNVRHFRHGYSLHTFIHHKGLNISLSWRPYLWLYLYTLSTQRSIVLQLCFIPAMAC
jgi:hypothetical protein